MTTLTEQEMAEVNADGLMPCPLPTCNNEAEYYALPVANYFEHIISCKECGLRLSICNTSKEMPPKSMFILWNTRAPAGGGG